MKTLLIIQTGSKLPSLSHIPGDFADWILAPMDLSAIEPLIAAVHKGEALPDWPNISGTIITGSPAMVTDHSPWIEQTAAWLKIAVERHIPTLGICFGHQLLAYTMGGEVTDNPQGIEVGTVISQRSHASQTDPLMQDLPMALHVQASHRQTVIKPPPDAICLSASPQDDNHSFRMGECAWGLQFHPEFSAAIVAHYVQHYRPLLEAQGTNVDAIEKRCIDSDVGSLLLQRFAAYVSAA